jgi:hypothetical protein
MRPMTGLAITIALLLALAFSARRLLRRRRLARLMSHLPGGRADSALSVGSFEEIDEQIRARRCPCGGRYEVRGEGSRAVRASRLRVVRVECGTCENQASVYFDVTGLFH